MGDETPRPPPEIPPAASSEGPAEVGRPQVVPQRPRPAQEARARRERGPRPDLVLRRDPVYRDAGGIRLRLDPPDLARLRELPGARGKTDEELGAEFLESHQARLLAAVAGDVAAPAELRVLVDPFSRQAFLALDKRIRGIVSF